MYREEIDRSFYFFPRVAFNTNSFSLYDFTHLSVYWKQKILVAADPIFFLFLYLFSYPQSNRINKILLSSLPPI